MKIKKLLAMLVAVATILASFPMTISAEDLTYEDFLYSVTDNVVTIEKCIADRTTTEITIPQTIDGMPVEHIANCTFWDSTDSEYGIDPFSITTITLPEGLKTIGARAFQELLYLENINLPSTLESIGGSAFMGCEKIKSITIPEKVTTIGSAFAGALGTKSGPVIETFVMNDNITAIDDYAFEGATIKNFVLSKNIETIGTGAFSKLSGVESIVIPEKVTVLNDFTFLEADIKNVTLPENLKEIGQFAVRGTKIVLPNSVESIHKNQSISNEIYIPKSLKTITGVDPEDELTKLFFGEKADVYYEGSEEEWFAIENMPANLGELVMHYNYTPEPVKPTTTVSTTGDASTCTTFDQESAKNVFTQEETNGSENLKLELIVNEVKTLAQDEQTVVNNLLDTLKDDYTQAMVLDIDLTKYVGEKEIPLTDLKGNEIAITINVPEDIQNENLAVIRIHDGVADILNDLDTSIETYTFKTDKFSTYILSTVEESKVESSTESKVESTTESKVESSTESKAESATESKVESATESKVESSTESKAESATESKVESSTESKVESATASKVESATESKVESSTESKVESSTESKDESSTESKDESATESDVVVPSTGGSSNFAFCITFVVLSSVAISLITIKKKASTK